MIHMVKLVQPLECKTQPRSSSTKIIIILKSFNVKYEYNNVVIEAEQNFDTLKKVTETFFSLDG